MCNLNVDDLMSDLDFNKWYSGDVQSDNYFRDNGIKLSRLIFEYLLDYYKDKDIAYSKLFYYNAAISFFNGSLNKVEKIHGIVLGKLLVDLNDYSCEVIYDKHPMEVLYYNLNNYNSKFYMFFELSKLSHKTMEGFYNVCYHTLKEKIESINGIKA